MYVNSQVFIQLSIQVWWVRTHVYMYIQYVFTSRAAHLDTCMYVQSPVKSSRHYLYSKYQTKHTHLYLLYRVQHACPNSAMHRARAEQSISKRRQDHNNNYRTVRSTYSTYLPLKNAMIKLNPKPPSHPPHTLLNLILHTPTASKNLPHPRRPPKHITKRQHKPK